MPTVSTPATPAPAGDLLPAQRPATRCTKNRPATPRPPRIWLASSLFHAALLVNLAVFGPIVIQALGEADPDVPVQVVEIAPPSAPLATPTLAPAPLEMPAEVAVEMEAVDAPEIEADLPDTAEASNLNSEAFSEDLLIDAKVVAGLGKRPASRSKYTGPKPSPVAPRQPPAETPAPAAPPAPRGPTHRASARSAIQADYPATMRSEGREARVSLRVLVHPSGDVGHVEVLTPDVPRAFIDSALRAVKRARFQAAMRNGVAIADHIRVNLTFVLR